MEYPHFSEAVRIERLAPGEEARREGWLRAIRGLDLSTAGVLKIDGTSAVWSTSLMGRAVVIKTWVHSSVRSRLKLFVGGGRGARHWRGAAWLNAHGFATAPTILLAVEKAGGGAVEWLVMERLEGRSLIEEMCEPRLSLGDQHELAHAVGVQAATMVMAGRFNRDHKPSNIIATAGGPAVIDCVAIRPCAPGHRPALERMLASLVIEPTGIGCRPRRAVLMRCVRAAGEALLGTGSTREARRDLSRGLWRRVQRAVGLHGDPRPRVDPRPV